MAKSQITSLTPSWVLKPQRPQACLPSLSPDYSMKGNLKRLLPAVERELRKTEMRRERRQAQEALKESEQRTRILKETT